MAFKLNSFDEYTHEVDPNLNFNESVYLNFYDRSLSLGGFFRLGNRVNQGYAEVTACLYLSDGSVAFYFQRPEIVSNEKFDAGGLSFNVVDPFERLNLNYKNKVLILKDPLELRNPSEAFKNNELANCEVVLDVIGCSDAFGGVAENLDNEMAANFAKGHYEQLIKVTGMVTIGSEGFNVNGLGLRDHSWGPRSWQAPYYYRWLTGNFSESDGFVASLITLHGGYQIKTGFYCSDGKVYAVSNINLETEWDNNYNQRRLTVSLELDNGSQEKKITGEVINNVPLRHVKIHEDGSRDFTRITEGLTKWSLNDKLGYGWAEYLDQILNHIPVGIH